MAQNTLDINTDPTERNLDVVQTKLNKILSTVQQINSSMSAMPGQWGGAASAPGSAANSAQPSPMASGGPGGSGYGGASMGHADNPSIYGSLMLSQAMRSGAVGGGGSSFDPSSLSASASIFSSPAAWNTDGYRRVVNDTMRSAIVQDRNSGQNLWPGSAQVYGDRWNSMDVANQGISGNASVAQAMNDPSNMSLMNPALYDHLGALQAQGVAQRSAFVSNNRLAFAGGLTSGVSQLGQAYARTTISGQQDPGAFGQIYGGIAGGLVGGAIAMSVAGAAAAGAAAGSVVPGFGTLIGAGIGATLGAAAMAVGQSGYIADNHTQGILAPYAASGGYSAAGMQDSAYRIARDYDNTQAGKAEGGGLWNYLTTTNGWVSRKLGIQTGTDNASEQQVAGVMSTLGSAYQNAGADPGGGRLQRLSRRILDMTGNGEQAEAVARSYAHAAGNINNAGGNLVDLYRIAGATDTNTMLRVAGRGAEAGQLNGAIAGIETSAYNSTGAASIAQGLSSDYGASGLSGASTLGRTGSFRAMMSGLQSQVGAVDAEMAALGQAPGGQNSNEYKAKSALKSELMKQIASESAQRAQGISTDIQGTSGVNLTSIAVTGTAAALYGSAGDIRAAAGATMGQLTSEANQLRGVTGLSFQDGLARDQRLASIALQQAALPAQAAGAAMRRSLLPLDVQAGQNSVAYQGAGLYGSDADLGNSALNGINGQQAIVDQGRRSLNDPALSLEDRAAVNNRINGAQSAMLSIRAGSRDTLLNRIEGRAGVVNSDLGNSLNRALSLGDGGAVRNAAIGTMGGLDAESASLAAQLSAGGLTAEQEIRLKGRQSAIAGQRFNIFQSSIDAAYHKDDLSNYDTQHIQTQGAQERLQYLPFSTSNPMRLSIQSLTENKAQLGVLSQREAELKRTGNLSPEREFEITQQRQNLLTENARSVGQLSEGMENRLPALSAGTPSFFGRYSSVQLAALNLQQSGSPIRGLGAVNGAHMRSQDDFVRAAGGDMHDVGPHSRTASLNSGASTDRLAAVLEKLVGVLDRGNATTDSTRPGERAGMVGGALSRQNLNQQGLYNSRN